MIGPTLWIEPVLRLARVTFEWKSNGSRCHRRTNCSMYSAFHLSDEYPKLHYWVTTFFLCPFNLGSYSSLYPPPYLPPSPPPKKKNNGKRCKEHPVRSVPFHLHWGWFPCFLLIIGKILRVSALASREAGAVTAKPFIGNKISLYWLWN